MSSNRTFTPSLGPTPSDLSASTSGTVPSSGPVRTKRPKTSQACESCRKHKTRCEQSSEGGSSCHRCNVLAITCSFEGSDNAPPPRRSVTLLPPPRQKTPDGPPTSTTKPKPLSVEDLVVGPTHHLGEPEESAGYYAQSPLGAIWDIMRKRPSGPVPTAPPEPFNVSGEALSVDQTHYLMSLFDRHYLPWLNIPHLRIEPGAPVHTSNFLVLACCAVACRHLPPPEAEQTLSLLQPMAEHAVLLRTFDPEAHASLEGLQGLLVLATWTPAIGAAHTQIHDSSLIATSAARMGMALKLETCSEKALALRGLAEERGTMSDEERLVYEELMWKVRLWVSVCNTEWILTTGTHRKPVSVRSQSDYQALDWRRFPAAGTIADYRDFRLGIAAQVSDAAARGVDKMFKDLDQFFKDIEEPVMSFNYARNIVQPLRFAFTMERMQMDYLYFQQHVARLLVLFHGMAQIRTWMGAHLKKRAWILELEQAGVRFVKHWGMQIIHTAQTILGLFFEIKERYFDYISPTADFKPLAAGPDALYAHVLFASSILLVSRYTLFWQFSIKDPVFTHSSAVLLSRLHAALSSLALGPEHAPRRAAAVINELQRVWHEKVMSTANGGTSIKMSLLSLAARAAENSDTTYSGSTAGTSNAGSSSCDDDPSRPQSHSPGGPMPPPVHTVPTSAAPTHVPPFPSVPVHPNSESYIPQQQYAYQHPHQHVDQHQQYLYPHQSSSQMPATAVADDPLFNELFSGFDQSTGVGSLNAQQQQYGQQGGIADPMSNFFPQMDPGNFLDNGFWDLFGNSVPADVAAPGSGGSRPQSNLAAMMFPQQ